MEENILVLIKELDRIHKDGFVDWAEWKRDDDFPNFNTSKSGIERYFSKKAQSSISSIASVIHSNDQGISSVIELKEFEKLLKQSVANLHVDGSFKFNSACDASVVRKTLIDTVKSDLSKISIEYTHYFPAWTVGMERDAPFFIGPVTFMSKQDWINSVEFSDWAIKNFSGGMEVNNDWKKALLQAIAEPNKAINLAGLAKEIYPVILDCSAIVKISIKGREASLSRKLAEIVCKSAIDATSLIFHPKDFFLQQALCSERLPPRETENLLESKGYLWLPGSKSNGRNRHQSYSVVRESLTEAAEFLVAVGNILDAQIDPTLAKYPQLSKRWSTALNWLGEGCRDNNDAVGLTKIASSLDVLACGGKFGGILNMLAHLLQITPDTQVITGNNPRTLREVVKDIYDHGRSQILHGSHYDRLKSFEEWKTYAAYFSRIALIESALRLDKFNGSDGDKEFRMMPR